MPILDLATQSRLRTALAFVVIGALAFLYFPRAGTPPAPRVAPASASAPPADQLVLDPVTAIDRALQLSVTIEGNGVYGAGFFIDPAAGLVLTSNHVVADMKAPRITTYTGRQAIGKVIASDRRRDIALVSAPELRLEGVPPPRIGDAARLKPGQDLYAVGMPRKLGFTVSRGIVSYVGRAMDGDRYLQLDMNINDGNSGGPVFLPDGRIVGVMSFIYRKSQGLAFALPVVEAGIAFPDRVAGLTAFAR